MWITQAYGQAGGAPGGGSDMLMQMAPLVLIFVVFYMLLIRPQQKKAKEQREKIGGVKRGDRVVLGGGIIGLVIKEIGEQEVQVELAEGVRVRVIRHTITDIISRGEPVRGARDVGKDAAEEEKPYLAPAKPAGDGAVQKPGGLLGSLLGRKKA